MHHLKDCVSSLMYPILSKRGDNFAEIAMNWTHILGEDAQYTLPIKIRSYIIANSKNAHQQQNVLDIEVLDQQQKLHIIFNKLIVIEKINNFFGKQVIHDISFSLLR